MSPLKRLIDEFLAPSQRQSVPDEFQRLLAGVSRLLDVTSVLAGEIDSERILNTITQEVCTALRCERASLFLYDDAKKELYTKVAIDLEIDEIRHGVEQGVSGVAARSRSIVSVADPENDEHWRADVDGQTGFHTRNILAAPLIAPHDGELLGVLELLNREGGAFDDTDEELLMSFCQHAAVALERARLVEELRSRQQTQTSLEVAREIQRDFMPSELPSIAGYEAATWWRSNQEVGGDYCDVIPLRNGRFVLAVADVSGHGLGPSLIMASLRAALHAMVLEHTEPEVLLNLLGRAMERDLRDGRFVTMALCVLDRSDNSVQYANAGHAPALHLAAKEREFMSLESTGMPLGVAKGGYTQGWPLELAVGDLLVLGTDGIIEAMDEGGKQFGQHRLENLLLEGCRQPIAQLVKHIGHEVEEHFAGLDPPDDLTLLILRRNR